MTERERALLQGNKINPLTANESALAYAVAHGGGSEPTYETVAEISVSAEHKAEVSDIPEWCHAYVVPNCASQAIAIDEADSRNITMYFNDAAYPLRKDNGMFFHNMTIVDYIPKRIEEDAPAFEIGFREDSSSSAQIVSSEDLSDTTIKILKKVEQGGMTDGKLVVHLTKSEVEGKMVYSADKTVAEIIAADAAGQVVVYEKDDGLQAYLIIADNESEHKACVFSVLMPDESTVDALVISAASEDGVDSWTVEEVEYVQVPTFDTTEDLGKVLTVTANGLAWVTPT